MLDSAYKCVNILLYVNLVAVVGGLGLNSPRHFVFLFIYEPEAASVKLFAADRSKEVTPRVCKFFFLIVGGVLVKLIMFIITRSVPFHFSDNT